MAVMLLGIVTLVRLEQQQKASGPRLNKPLGIETLDKLAQLKKAPSSILDMVEGIVTLVITAHE